MLKMVNICIICSSPAEYDIFAPIPAYLHASTNEFLLWPKHISQMLEETTGLLVTVNETLLPRKMCALCISYLKHAATFRQQAIDNILNIKARQLARCADKTTESNKISVNENELNFSQNRCADIKNIMTNKQSFNKCDDYFKRITQNVPNNTRKNNVIESQSYYNNDESNKSGVSTNNHLNTYLNLLFDKDTNKTANNRRKHSHRQSSGESNTKETEFDEILTASSDDNEIYNNKSNFFNYKEKNFEEDDIINDILNDANITINIPDICKERKCPSCCKRFMFENSYEEHISDCLEYQLQMFIEEINRLLIIRRKKTISPHEFIRRMIFSLKKVSELLRSRGENIITVSASSSVDKPLEKKSERKKSLDSEQFNSLNTTIVENAEFNTTVNALTSLLEASAKKISSTNNQIKKKFTTSTPEKIETIDQLPANTFQTIQQKSARNSTPPSLCRDQESKKNKKFNTVLLTPVGHLSSESTLIVSPSPQLLKFSARCSVCNIVFETIGALEDHNAKFHNHQLIENEEHKKIIALFDDE